MAPANSINFRPTDPKEKKAAVLAVISFNDAYHVPYSKGKVSEYFGINERTARKWCAEAAAATTTTTTVSQTAHQLGTTTPDPTEARGIKRSLSEVATAEILSPSISPGSTKGQTPARKAAQGQKKKQQQRNTDVKNEIVTPSPSPPRQLVTATTPGRVAASQQRKKQRRLDDSTGAVQIGDGSADDYVAV